MQSSQLEKTKEFLAKHQFPVSDYQGIENNPAKEFSVGGHYGVELSSMNNPKILTKALNLAKQFDVDVCRVIECRGIVRLPDAEIKAMVDICGSQNIGLFLSVGPRAISDIGGFAGSKNGARIGYRLRGIDRILQAVEDIYRGIALGVKGFLLYDEGLLYLLNEMRIAGELPQDIIFKYSVHAGCSNPFSAKLLEIHGADCINIIPDLDIWQIKAFRHVVTVPIDVFSDTAKSAGGFLRTYDVPEMIRYASPLYLKCGPISQPEQNHLPSDNELEERVKQARNVVEHVKRYIPEAKRVSVNEPSLAIPSVSAASHQDKNLSAVIKPVKTGRILPEVKEEKAV